MSIKYTYVAHGTHLLDIDGTKLVIDPYFDDNPGTEMKAADIEADFIVVSHGHGDHIADAAPIAKRTGAPIISVVEIIDWLNRQGVEEVRGMHIGGGHTYPFGYLKLTHAQHGSGLPDGSYGGNPAGILIKTNAGKNIYFACDTGLFGDMALIGEEGIDLAVLPIGDNYTMGPDDALKAVKLIKPKNVVPCHYNTWPVVEQDGEAWGKRVAEETDAVPHVLKPGESLEV